MKLITHDIFAFGLASFILARLIGIGLGKAVVIAFVLSIAINRIIDAGHVRAKGIPRRSYVTHSVITTPIIGATIGALLGYGLSYLFSSARAPYIIAIIGKMVVAVAVVGALVASSHLLLDALTEGGVYRWKRRVALVHWRYDNAVVNGLAIMAGVALLLLAVVR